MKISFLTVAASTVLASSAFASTQSVFCQVGPVDYSSRGFVQLVDGTPKQAYLGLLAGKYDVVFENGVVTDSTGYVPTDWADAAPTVADEAKKLLGAKVEYKNGVFTLVGSNYDLKLICK